MKSVFYIAVLLFLRLGALAQNKAADPAAQYTFKDSQSNMPDFPLIVLNDKIYDGNLADLKMKIRHIEIYKGPGACAIYGVKAANGLIIMGTEQKLPMYFSKPSTDTSFDGNVVYVIDGKLAGRSHIDEKEILIRSTLNGRVVNSIYGRKLDSIVIIITREYAVEQYQKKLSAFSEDYKKEIAFDMKYNHNDDGIFYMILEKGQPGLTHSDDLIRALYNLPVERISKVELGRQQTCCGINTWVGISLKQ